MERDRDKMLANARRTQRNLNEKRSRNGGTLSKADERKLVRAQGVLAHDAKENQEAYRTGLFGNMSQGEKLGDEGTILGQFKGDDMFMERNEKGEMELNADKTLAALDSIADADKLTAAYGALSATEGFQKKMAESAEFRSRVASVMAAKGDPFNKSIAKIINAGGVGAYEDLAGQKHEGGYSLADMVTERQEEGKHLQSKLQEKVQGMGTGAMTGIDKDALKTEFTDANGNSVKAWNVLSDSQIAAGVGEGYSGSVGDNYAKMVQDMMQEAYKNAGGGLDGQKAMEAQISAVAGNITQESLSGMSVATVLAAGGYGGDLKSTAAALTASGGDVESMTIAGKNEAEMAQIRQEVNQAISQVQSHASQAIDQVKTASGDATRAAMNQVTANVLGIKTNTEPIKVEVVDHSGGTTPPGGHTGPSGHAGPSSDPMDLPRA